MSKEKKNIISVKQLVVISVCIAIAFVTSNLKLINMPMGGSITLFSMLFIALTGQWYGLFVGLLTGFIYGLLQLIIDPYVLSIPQVICDYFFAFGALGLSGIFKKMQYGRSLKIKGVEFFKVTPLHAGYIVSVFGRFVFSVLSGVIFFAQYAPEGWNTWIYSLAYNGAYIGAEAVLTLIVLSLPPVVKMLSTVERMAKE